MQDARPQQVVCAVCGYKSAVYKDKSTDRVYCPVCQFSVNPDGPVPLDDLTIARFLETVNKPTFILFWSPWEQQSGEMYTLLSMETRITRQQKVISAAVNVGENPESKRQYGVEILPTMLVYSFGREINRVVGPLTSFEISQLMKRDHF